MARTKIGAAGIILAFGLSACGTTVDLTQSAKPAAKPAYSNQPSLSIAHQEFRGAAAGLTQPLWSSAVQNDDWMASMTNILVHGMASEEVSTAERDDPAKAFVADMLSQEPSAEDVVNRLARELENRNAKMRRLLSSGAYVVRYYQTGEITTETPRRTTPIPQIIVTEVIEDQSLMEDLAGRLEQEKQVYAEVEGALKEARSKLDLSMLSLQIEDFAHAFEQVKGLNLQFARALEDNSTSFALLENQQ